MDISVTYDASAAAAPAWYAAAVQAAIGKLDAVIETPITLNIKVGWGEENNNSIGSSYTAQNQSTGAYLKYDTLRGALAAHATSADDLASVSALPTTDPLGGTNIYVPNAMLKSLGIVDPQSASTDGYVGLSATRPWAYAPDGAQPAGTFDPVSILEHEFSEILGRVGFLGSSAASGVYGPMDLFRFSGPGQRALTPGDGYFSVDGQAMLGQFNNPLTGGDAADWSARTLGDTFGDSVPGLAATLSSTDLRLLDVLGYTVAAPAAAVPAAPVTAPAPALAIDTNVVFTNANTAILTGTVSDPAAAVAVYDGATLLGQAAVASDGTWSLDATLPAGDHMELAAEATTAAGATSRTAATMALQTGITGQPYSTLEQDFDAAGNLVAESYNRRRGTVYLQDTVSDIGGGRHLMDYTAGSYLDNNGFAEIKDVMSADWNLVSRTTFGSDGSHTITGSKAGLTLASLGDDTMTGGAGSQTFLFKPMAGQELVTDFQATGADHDTLNLSRFAQLADVSDVLSLAHAVGHDTVLALNPATTITLQNVSLQALAAHPEDFKFHG